MANKNNDKKSKARVRNPELENTLNYYSEEMTKEVVGRLFEEYASDDGKNYFVNRPKIDDVLYNAEEDERDEEDEQKDEREVYKSIKLYTPRRVRSKRTDSSLKRNKSKKKLRQEMEEEYDENLDESVDENINENLEEYSPEVEDINEDNIDFEEEAAEEAAPAKAPKRKSSFLPKLNELGKAYKQDIDEDEYEEPEDEEDTRGMYDDEDEDIDEEDDGYNVINVSRDTIIIFALVIIIIIVSVSLAIRGNRYKNQLEAAIVQIEEITNANTSSTYETELAELKAKVESLTAENEELKASGASGAGAAVLSNVEADIEASSSAETDSAESASDTYTVVEGDTFWKISQSVYGNGAEYQKILDANGMNENSPLKIGQELKIPK